MKTKDEVLKRCPECSYSGVTTTLEQKFMVNTGEHYCFSFKPQDSDAKASCLNCDWVGKHKDLKGFNYD